MSVQKCTTLESEKEKSKWAKLLFYPPISNSIRKVFARHNLKTANYSSNKIKSLLGSTKDKIPEIQKSGIYKITCDDCPFVYIGQTIRSIQERYKEHDYHFRFCHSEKSSVAKHRHETGHKITQADNLSLLHQVIDNRQIDAYETLFIHKEKSPLMNADFGPIQFSSLFKLV